ncbi:MAG: hypothetical protein H6650_16200 [Ardenticatenales bacterium]|nr:hypothetical protein [Ardenticatenales bacterium]
MLSVNLSLYAFMAGLIDYAGIFPPANLPLNAALANYATYVRHPDRWMLARFILPAARLRQLTPDQIAPFDADHPLALSLLGSGGDDFLAGVRADLDALAALRRQYGARVTGDAYEVRLPAAADLSGLLTAVGAPLQEAGLRPFYEIPFDATWESRLRPTAWRIATHNNHFRAQAGFKLRCGGVTADAFPAVTQVAAAIVACRDAGIPLKATAGLHHPFRHFSADVNTHMHGFVNLFGAAILAHVYHLRADEIAPILADENPANFTFTDAHFAWGDLSASVLEIDALRAATLISYGSCSFDEPRQDLQQHLSP